MKLQTVAYWLVGVMLASVTACATPPNSTTNTASSPEAQSLNTSESPAVRALPDTKIANMSVEGQATEVTLQLFDQAGFPFFTYYPQEFTVEAGGADEGQGARFYFSPDGIKDENAYLQIFIPAGSISLEKTKELIFGDKGLLTSNNWEIVDRTEVVTTPWATEKVVYQQMGGESMITGTIYIGENNGQGFYVFTHYPAEYGDGFAPRADLILNNLEFRE